MNEQDAADLETVGDEGASTMLAQDSAVARLRARLTLLDEIEKAKCAKCRHWGTGEAQARWDEDHTNLAEGAPDISPPPDQRICAAVTLLHDGSNHFGAPVEERRVRLAYLVDASSYRADMWTAAKFGCVSFEAK